MDLQMPIMGGIEASKRILEMVRKQKNNLLQDITQAIYRNGSTRSSKRGSEISSIDRLEEVC